MTAPGAYGADGADQEASPPATDALDQVCRGAAELLRALGHPLRRLTVRVGDVLVEIEWPESAADAGSGTPVTAVLTDPAGPAAGPDQSGPSAHVITAPHVGTFYRCPEPGSDPFVAEGDPVRRGQQIGILEAMKLMNPVQADRDGRVLEVLVADGSPVEFAQPLIALAITDTVPGRDDPNGAPAATAGVAGAAGAGGPDGPNGRGS
ncbi:MAG TPA: acetyl-CoA carboxylase biotin carboxyl carrier protein subunit [Mycobacteriales bacterium]|nr:acetyl-CoA carboxylase biotin carboxyl carrier protein subunit [Mycobacteriales bacterium]